MAELNAPCLWVKQDRMVNQPFLIGFKIRGSYQLGRKIVFITDRITYVIGCDSAVMAHIPRTPWRKDGRFGDRETETRNVKFNFAIVIVIFIVRYRVSRVSTCIICIGMNTLDFNLHLDALTV